MGDIGDMGDRGEGSGSAGGCTCDPGAPSDGPPPRRCTKALHSLHCTRKFASGVQQFWGEALSSCHLLTSPTASGGVGSARGGDGVSDGPPPPPGRVPVLWLSGGGPQCCPPPHRGECVNANTAPNSLGWEYEWERKKKVGPWEREGGEVHATSGLTNKNRANDSGEEEDGCAPCGT